MTNLLIALKNIIEEPVTDLIDYYNWSNRANNMWDALEVYVKDIFCNSLDKSNYEKDILYSENFSYLGNTNNPPDMIIKNSDAIEVKKIESVWSAIALNSSYPKDKLYRNDTRITNECKECESDNWDNKDIIYIVWVSPKSSKKLKAIWFIYWNCYAADKNIYQRIADVISSWINQISDVELVDTNELAKVKKVDPLWITDLRVRWMWHIDNPIKVFSDVASIGKDDEFTVNSIILEDKYLSFPENDRKNLESLIIPGFSITNIQIKSPNNPAKLLNAKLISYVK